MVEFIGENTNRFIRKVQTAAQNNEYEGVL